MGRTPQVCFSLNFLVDFRSIHPSIMPFATLRPGDSGMRAAIKSAAPCRRQVEERARSDFKKQPTQMTPFGDTACGSNTMKLCN